MKDEDPILYEGCNSAFFSAATLIASILGAGLLTITALIIELL